MERARRSGTGGGRGTVGGNKLPVNLSRYAGRRPATLLPDRRRAWFACVLTAGGLVACAGAAIVIAAQGSNDAAATVPVHVDLRPLSPTIEGAPVSGPSAPDLSALGVPDVTGSIGPRAGDQPALRPLSDDRGAANASSPVARAAIMAAKMASFGLPGLAPEPSRPRVLDDGSAVPRAGRASNTTVLVKRPAAASRSAGETAHSLTVAAGDTLYDILARHSVDTSEAVALTRALAKVFSPSRLRTGQAINLKVAQSGAGAVPLEFALIDNGRDIAVRRGADGTYVASLGGQAVGETAMRRAVGTITGSLYGSARAKGVPDSLIVRMMRTHSYDVDFQRDIHAGDRFEVFYANGEGDTESLESNAQVLFSSLSTGNETHSYYRYVDTDGTVDFYDETGSISRKPLMKTPINGARISSNFGMRKHPILGYTKLHAGTDFAAPTGTPVLAAGDGTIETAGANGGYGNYIRIKHKDGVKTAYAHLSRFAKGIKAGSRVRQGDVIGFVGTTGRSTGPHLHYEVLVNGKKENPQTVKVAGVGRKLESAELRRFLDERDRIDALRAEAGGEALVAVAQP